VTRNPRGTRLVEKGAIQRSPATNCWVARRLNEATHFLPLAETMQASMCGAWLPLIRLSCQTELRGDQTPKFTVLPLNRLEMLSFPHHETD
jgi:hypothetical protein